MEIKEYNIIGKLNNREYLVGFLKSIGTPISRYEISRDLCYKRGMEFSRLEQIKK